MSILNWKYFITLESDLNNISRYVEICEENYSTYSIEFARLILASCSEIDVVAKMLCKRINSKCKCGNISDYRNVITKDEPDFHRFEILIKSNNKIITPWEEWKYIDKNPGWWQKYNDIKHERDINFKEANLKNALYSISGLFAIILCLDIHEYYSLKLKPLPKLLDLKPEYAVDIVEHSSGKIPYLKYGS